MSVRLVPASQLSRSKTAPSIPTSPLAAMAAVSVEVAAAVVCPAMVVRAAEAEAEAVAPEDMVEMQLLLMLTGVLVVEAPSSMVETVLTQGALAHTSAAAQAAAIITTAMPPLAPAVEAVEAHCTVAAS